MILKFTTNTQEGEKDGKTWKRCTAVFETVEKFPKQVAVTYLNDNVEVIKKYRPGHLLKVSMDADSHEYEGKWFTELRAWKTKPAYEIPREDYQQAVEEKPSFDENIDPI